MTCLLIVYFPHNHEAEQAVLGAILLEPGVLVSVNERLKPDDFYRQSHQRLFQVMNELGEQGEPVDLVTLTAELQDRKLLEEVGGSDLSQRTGQCRAYRSHAAEPAELDKQGRIVLPDRLRAYANLGANIAIVGMNTFLELWDLPTWETLEGEVEAQGDIFAAHLAGQF